MIRSILHWGWVVFRTFTGNWGSHLVISLKYRKCTKVFYRQKTFSDSHCKRTDIFYFILDKRFQHPGLADRLKAIVSCYYIAIQNGYKFKIIADEPYSILPYLKPASVDWIGNFEDLEYSLNDTISYNFQPWKGIPRFKRQKQIHCFNYVGESVFPHIKEGILWGDLFSELFTPTDELGKAISLCNMPSYGYVAVHLRFVNSLEHFEGNYQKHLSKKTKINLIKRCKGALEKICKETHGIPVYVFSDSKVFLDSLNNLPVRVLNTNHIAHIGNKLNKDSAMKTFVDFFIMSKANCIYRIVTEGMYPSEFCLYAAKLGNKPFIKIEI